MRQPENAQVLAQAEALNQLFDEKAFSWTLAMEDLETVLPGGVQVTSIEPTRDKDGHITLHLRVLGPRDRAIELVANLEHSQALSSAAHRGRKPGVERRAGRARGAGERLEPRQLRSAGRVQPGCRRESARRPRRRAAAEKLRQARGASARVFRSAAAGSAPAPLHRAWPGQRLPCNPRAGGPQ